MLYPPLVLIGKEKHQNFVSVALIKKEIEIFLIYKEIQMGSVAKSYMRKAYLIYEEMRKNLTIFEEAVSHKWLCNRTLPNFLLNEENFLFFLSVWGYFSNSLPCTYWLNLRETISNGKRVKLVNGPRQYKKWNFGNVKGVVTYVYVGHYDYVHCVFSAFFSTITNHIIKWKNEWLVADGFLIRSSVGLVNGPICQRRICKICPANGKQWLMAWPIRSKKILTKYMPIK